jgi:hypothetical protein
LSKIEPTLRHAKIVSQPLVRNFSTGGGHGPADTLIEGDGKIVTAKWQGFTAEGILTGLKQQRGLS